MDKFKKKRILVVGDFMLDVYTFGEVNRISPEAPVPVLRVTSESRRPGGAGNAVLNLVSLGMEVAVLGRIGDDEGGNLFLESLRNEGVHTEGLIKDKGYQTPLKNRMIAAGQQIVRIDYENPAALSQNLEEKVAEIIPQLLDRTDVIAVSDYAKGFLTPSLLAKVISAAKERNIPVIVDPKGRDFNRYRGSTILKPNLSEAIAAAGLGIEATLDEVAFAILEKVDVEILLLTRSKDGISIFDRKRNRIDFPARVHEVKDVTGAGDTVLAVITASMANRFDLSDAAKLANIAAGLAIERVGCARISVEELSPHLVELAHDRA